MRDGIITIFFSFKSVLCWVVSFFTLIISCSNFTQNVPDPCGSVHDFAKNKIRLINYKTGSKFGILQSKLDKGTKIELVRYSKENTKFISNPYIVTEQGYLISIDENPTYDWAHHAKYVFLPERAGATPIVIFDGIMLPSVNISDGNGLIIISKHEQFIVVQE